MDERQIARFREALGRARRVTVLTGAGISAESGVPTFRGAGGLWRRWAATDLATPEAFARDPGLVWEFYDYRRKVVADVKPNAGHAALAAFEARWTAAGRGFTLVTQNVDGLHEAAGSQAVTRLHGSLWHVRCTRCGEVRENRAVPITPAFAGAGSPDPNTPPRRFGPIDMPYCSCGGLLRPHIVWFGESLDPRDLDAASDAALASDVFLVVGTSAVVYPAAGLIPLARNHGARVFEVNLEDTQATGVAEAHFAAAAGVALPRLLDGLPE